MGSLILVRHATTAASAAGRNLGKHTDLPLSDDGFAARVTAGADGRTLTLLQSHCAIEGIAREHPEICAHEAALFTRVLGTKVSRRDTIAKGAAACVCHIDLPDNPS